MVYILVKAPVRVYYGKYCTRGVSRGAECCISSRDTPRVQYVIVIQCITGARDVWHLLHRSTRAHRARGLRAINAIHHERNRCFDWFIVVALRLEMRFLADQPLRFPVSTERSSYNLYKLYTPRNRFSNRDRKQY